jgi:hypothetical protein
MASAIAGMGSGTEVDIFGGNLISNKGVEKIAIPLGRDPIEEASGGYLSRDPQNVAKAVVMETAQRTRPIRVGVAGGNGLQRWEAKPRSG